MNLELHDKLKRENMENIDEREIAEPKRRCSLSDSVSRALQVPEVVIRIMEYLPDTSDHINLRCLGGLWKIYCKPKFVFRKSDSPSLDVMPLLYNSGCRFMKLEFQDYPLMHIPVDMWEKLGRKIRSLNLHCCDFENETLRSIISNCISLEDLEICRKNVFHFSPELSFVQLLDYFIEKREQRTYLRRLAINGNKFINMSEFLRKIFTVFPRIVNLSFIVQECYDDDGGTLSAVGGNYDLQKLRSFTMISKNDYLWSSNPVMPMLDYPSFRLTKFKTVLFGRSFREDYARRKRLFQFFITQKDLEVVELEILETTYDVINFTKPIIFHVLKTCSNLREFQLISSSYSVSLNFEEYIEFFLLISNLQSLMLPCILEKDTSRSSSLSPNLSLSVLQLNTKDSCFFSVMISMQNPHLKHLSIDVYSDQQLSEIIMVMPNLETLILRLHDCTNYGFIGENGEYSIRRLQKLGYLEIIDRKGRTTKEVFDEFRFPCLKHLKLSLRSRASLPETLLHIPAIRTLNVQLERGKVFQWRTESLTQFCKSLENLEHVFVDELVYENLPVENIFNSLLKLRCIVSREITFLFNRFSGQAICSLTRDLEFFKNKFFLKMYTYHIPGFPPRSIRRF